MSGYLGDKETKLVHHLGNMQDECNIYNIGMGDRQYFTPDSLETAKNLGFKPCPECN